MDIDNAEANRQNTPRIERENEILRIASAKNATKNNLPDTVQIHLMNLKSVLLKSVFYSPNLATCTAIHVSMQHAILKLLYRPKNCMIGVLWLGVDDASNS